MTKIRTINVTGISKPEPKASISYMAAMMVKSYVDYLQDFDFKDVSLVIIEYIHPRFINKYSNTSAVRLSTVNRDVIIPRIWHGESDLVNKTVLEIRKYIDKEIQNALYELLLQVFDKEKADLFLDKTKNIDPERIYELPLSKLRIRKNYYSVLGIRVTPSTFEYFVIVHNTEKNSSRSIKLIETEERLLLEMGYLKKPGYLGFPKMFMDKWDGCVFHYVINGENHKLEIPENLFD